MPDPKKSTAMANLETQIDHLRQLLADLVSGQAKSPTEETTDEAGVLLELQSRARPVLEESAELKEIRRDLGDLGPSSVVNSDRFNTLQKIAIRNVDLEKDLDALLADLAKGRRALAGTPQEAEIDGLQAELDQARCPQQEWQADLHQMQERLGAIRDWIPNHIGELEGALADALQDAHQAASQAVASFSDRLDHAKSMKDFGTHLREKATALLSSVFPAGKLLQTGHTIALKFAIVKDHKKAFIDQMNTVYWTEFSMLRNNAEASVWIWADSLSHAPSSMHAARESLIRAAFPKAANGLTIDHKLIQTRVHRELDEAWKKAEEDRKKEEKAARKKKHKETMKALDQTQKI
jgi:predicted  nucleic acid-binding Zn-ribbon protein